MHIVTSIILMFVVGSNALTVTNTGPTPPPCGAKLSPSACVGRSDGNYEFVDKDNAQVLTNFFTQCSNGIAYCQPCWPQSLQFSPRCNQCLYSKNANQPKVVSITIFICQNKIKTKHVTCPDLCPAKGPTFRGNIADPSNPFHYVGCWDGVTVGCVVCPASLEFNEPWNACLYDGLYVTEP